MQLLGQFCTKLTNLLPPFRKYRLMPPLLSLLVKVPGPVGPAIVFQLQRVAASQDLRRTHKAVERLLILLQDLYIVSCGCIAGHDKQHGDGFGIAAGSLPVIGQVLEHHPLVEGTERSTYIPQIVVQAGVMAQARLNFSLGCLQRGQRQSSPRSSKAMPSCSAGSYT